MKNTTDGQNDQCNSAIIACRVSYTLNNRQPVRCTYIGDQPLFFMDYEGAMDEDDFTIEHAHEDAAFAAIEEGLRDLQNRIETASAGERGVMSAEMEHSVGSFIADGEAITARRGKDSGGKDISALEKTLRRSRIASAYLDFAAEHGGGLAYNTQLFASAYDRHTGKIMINPELDTADQILMAAKGLRQCWQHRKGALIHPLSFHPDQAILISRAQAADLCAAQVRVAWELQLSGESASWERLESSPMSDLTRAFAREAHLDFRTLNNGAAASAVFEAWFLSERCRHEDRRLIQQMLSDYKGYVFDNQIASQGVTSELLYALGSMPFGKNYLMASVQTILADALYSEIRDRSNANFLWFVKFERSFRETEQELQKDMAAGASVPASTDEKAGNNHEKSAEIISLQAAPDQPARSAQGGGNVLSFPRNK